jgi:hypothetical protein
VSILLAHRLHLYPTVESQKYDLSFTGYGAIAHARNQNLELELNKLSCLYAHNIAFHYAQKPSKWYLLSNHKNPQTFPVPSQDVQTKQKKPKATGKTALTASNHRQSEVEKYLDPAPTTGVHTSEPIILGHSNGISAGDLGASGLSLVVLLLVFLNILGETLALLVEFLVLSLDLGLAVLGVGTTTASTVLFILLANFTSELERMTE